MVLPVNIDSSFADSTVDASAKTHQQHHDTIHGLLNTIWDDTSGKINPNVIPAGTGGGTPAPSQDLTVLNALNYGALGSVEATNNATITAAVNAASAFSRNPLPVYIPPGDYPTSLTFTDMSVNLDVAGTLIHPLGKTALLIQYNWGSAIPVTIADVQFGPTNAAEGTGTQVLSGITLASGSYTQFKSGDVVCANSQNEYAWSLQANPGVGLIWKAEQRTLRGIVLELNTVSNGGPVETVMVKGATSNSQGLVQSFASKDDGKVQVLFTSVTGNFTSGENIITAVGGQTTTAGTIIGTAGIMYAVTSGHFQHTYTTSPVVRIMPKQYTCKLKYSLDIPAGQDFNSYQVAAQRLVGVMVEGAYKPEIQVTTFGSWTRNLIVKSCYKAKILARIDAGPNQANADQGGFGYGIEFRGCSYNPVVEVHASNTRHPVTTNPVGSTYANGKYREYGTTQYLVVQNSTAEGCLNAFDTHPGAEFTRYVNCRNIQVASANRSQTTSAGGFNNRGHGTTTDNCLSEGGRIGFTDGSGEYSCDFVYTNRLLNSCGINVQKYGYYQSVDDIDTNSYHVVKNCLMSGDPRAGAAHFQIMYKLANSQTVVVDCEAASFSGVPMEIVGASAGKYRIGLHSDYTLSTGVNGIRVSGTLGMLELSKITFTLNLTAATPQECFVNTGSSNTAFRLGQLDALNGSVPKLYTIVSGTPNFTSRAGLQNVKQQSSKGDTSATVTPRTDNPIQRWTAPITANRTCTLSLSAGTAMSGDQFTITRDAGATGAFTLNIVNGTAGTVIKTVAIGTWADVIFDGTNWVVLRAGSQ